MIKTALIIGVILGAGYYAALSLVWDTTLTQAQANQQHYQQAVTMTEQLALQPTTNR